MKILHIASGDKWAGAEVQVWTLCTELVKQGQTVHAIVLNPGRLAEMLGHSGVTVTVLDESRFGFSKLLEKIKLELHRWQPDVIHTHRQKENILGALANKMTISAPSFRTVHGAPEFAPSFKQRLQISADRFAGKRLQNGVISVSDDLTEKLKVIYPAEKIHTIANGICAATVRADSKKALIEPLSKSFVHIGLVGRIETVKRVDIFLDTAAKLLHESRLPKPPYFHIFGEGSLLPEMQQKASQLGIAEQVTFHGHTHNVRGWIANMDLLMMTSDHEGLPMTALESLALGVPMVAHATGGLVPLLKGGAKGQGLVYEHSAAGYYNTVVDVLTSPHPVSLPEEYSSANNASQITALYRKMTGL